MLRGALLALVLAAGETAMARTAVGAVQVLKGNCIETSHTVEGLRDSDRAQVQSKLSCDTAILTELNDAGGHYTILFATKDARAPAVMGFAGQMKADGVVMTANKVHFPLSRWIDVTSGSCVLSYIGSAISDISCSAMADQGRRRATAIVSFEAAR